MVRKEFTGSSKAQEKEKSDKIELINLKILVHENTVKTAKGKLALAVVCIKKKKD